MSLVFFKCCQVASAFPSQYMFLQDTLECWCCGVRGTGKWQYNLEDKHPLRVFMDKARKIGPTEETSHP